MLVTVQRLSLDCRRYNGIRGCSDIGICRIGDHSGTIPRLSEINGIAGYSDTGVCRMGGSSRDYPWTVVRYNGIRGYSDTGVCGMGGRPGTIPGLLEIQWDTGGL